MTKLLCRCGTPFICGMRVSQDAQLPVSCWCMNIEPTRKVPIEPGSECVCPDCLLLKHQTLECIQNVEIMTDDMKS